MGLLIFIEYLSTYENDNHRKPGQIFDENVGSGGAIYWFY